MQIFIYSVGCINFIPQNSTILIFIVDGFYCFPLLLLHNLTKIKEAICSSYSFSTQDIVDEPHLLIDGMSKDDIKQGTLGDCWFLSSCAAVSREERFMKRVKFLMLSVDSILKFVS